eukprot:362156-Chlamydomonas_euryale.AAC.16
MAHHMGGSSVKCAAAGVTGIMYVLVCAAEAGVLSDQIEANSLIEEVQLCTAALLAMRTATGNLPSSLGSSKDTLVQLCHGAPGLAFLCCKLSELLGPSGGSQYLKAALAASDVVWDRGLLKKVRWPEMQSGFVLLLPGLCCTVERLLDLPLSIKRWMAGSLHHDLDYDKHAMMTLMHDACPTHVCVGVGFMPRSGWQRICLPCMPSCCCGRGRFRHSRHTAAPCSAVRVVCSTYLEVGVWRSRPPYVSVRGACWCCSTVGSSDAEPELTIHPGVGRDKNAWLRVEHESCLCGDDGRRWLPAKLSDLSLLPTCLLNNWLLLPECRTIYTAVGRFKAGHAGLQLLLAV